jgi:hypothetical protein
LEYNVVIVVASLLYAIYVLFVERRLPMIVATVNAIDVVDRVKLTPPLAIH